MYIYIYLYINISAECAPYNYWLRDLIKKMTRINGQRHRETQKWTDRWRDKQTHKLNWTPWGSSGPQCQE